jgi:hypothetical protein
LEAILWTRKEKKKTTCEVALESSDGSGLIIFFFLSPVKGDH